MFKRFVRYYKPHRRLLCADMGASLLVAMIGILYPIVTRTMLNDLIPNRRYQQIILAGLGLLALYGVRLLLNYFIQYKGHMMGVRIQAQMRSDLFNHLERLPFSFYDAHETGKIMSRMTTDLFEITELAHHGPENLLISTISVGISFAYLATIHWGLALIIFACVPLLVLVSMKTRRKMNSAFAKSRQSTARINAALQSSISGIRVTKAFNNAAKESEKFEEGNVEFQNASRDAYRALGEFNAGTTFIADVFNVVVLIAGGLFLYGGAINFADYSAFVVSIGLFLTPVNTLIRFMEQYENGVVGFKRFLEVMDQPVEADAPDAIDAGRLCGHIEFRDVCSGYGDRDVLNHVNLDIPQGATFALVGPSGGGKTTICHLIPHFYDIRSGEIRIDGLDWAHLTRESLRRNIGIVQQDIYLFKAAKRANIHDAILQMEHGYDTIIGERGVRLSGGQKQRLCIARVFLKNPPILILDEATSALDNTTEILIQQALDELCKGRTTIVVAHRLSTIKHATEIAVIADGCIIERGDHAALLAQNGIYAQLYREQFRDE